MCVCVCVLICNSKPIVVFLTAATPSIDMLMPCVQRGIYMYHTTTVTVFFIPPPPPQYRYVDALYTGVYMYLCATMQPLSSTMLLTAVQTSDALCTQIHTQVYNYATGLWSHYVHLYMTIHNSFCLHLTQRHTDALDHLSVCVYAHPEVIPCD